ncbi:MAG: hypothetical protein Q9201_003907 [Fulgogasparrea decipioides]
MEDFISFWHDLCYKAFDVLDKTLKSNPKYENDFPQEVLSDSSGRFNVWAGNIGAGQQGRASLDYRLREATEVKDHVISTLRYLHETLQETISITSGARLPYDQLPIDTDSDSSTSSPSTADGNGQNLGVADEAPPDTELEQLQHALTTFISNLYKISVIIRKNQAPNDRMIKAAKIDTSFYEFFDERHVLEKHPTADASLVKRLGSAISRRRKYFKYREEHRQKLSQQKQPAGVVGHNDKKVNHPVFNESRDLPLDNIDQQRTHEGQAPSLVQLSHTKESTTASTFYARDVSALWMEKTDQVSEAGTQTSFGSTLSMQNDSLAIPPPPNSALGGNEFECPYCYTICRLRASDTWQQQREWERHVLRDLQPYICTFGGCYEMNTLFERRRDWIAHELQSHRTEWCCNTPEHPIYDSRTEFQSHMKRQHPGSFDMDQLDSFTNMVARPASNLKFSCPLCCSDRFVNLSIDKLEKHLGRHLEVIATFALPSNGTKSPTSQESIVTGGAIMNDTSSSGTTGSANENNPNDTTDISTAGTTSRASLEIFDEVGESSEQALHKILDEFGDEFRDYTLPSELSRTGVLTFDMQPSVQRTLSDSNQNQERIRIVDVIQNFIKRATHQINPGMLDSEDNISEPKNLSSPTSLRQSLVDFLNALIMELPSSRKDESFIDLLNGLKNLRSKINSYLPSSIPDGINEDWHFLRNENVNVQDAEPPETTLKEVCNWLTTEDQPQILAETVRLRHPLTGNWVFDFKPYLKLRSGAIQLLLLEGLPGCGKTVLCSAIIQELQRQSCGCAFYFFKSRSAAKRAMDIPIRSLIAQLVRLARQMPVALQELYQTHQEGHLSPSLDQFLDILHKTFDFFEETFIIVDGLDMVARDMSKTFARIIESGIIRGQKIRLLATSRISFGVETAIRFSPYICHYGLRYEFSIIPRRAVDNDIDTAVRPAVINASNIRSYDPKDLMRIIVEGSKGMFIWASTLLDQFEQGRAWVPWTIQNLWTGILERVIVQATEEDMKCVIQVLHTLSVCKRPLNAKELDQSLSYDFDSSTWGHRHYRYKSEIWHRLPALLELTGQPKNDDSGDHCWTECLALIHPSLTDFLQSTAIRTGPRSLRCFAVDQIKAQRNIAKTCVAYLLRWDGGGSYKSWAAYAGAFWHVHIKDIDSDTYLVSECTRLLNHQAPSFAHWIYMSRRDASIDGDEKGDFGKKDTYPSPLYYAALLGLRGPVKALLERGADVNAQGGKHRYPMLAAVAARESQVVKLLLEHGADPNSRYSDTDSGLIKAVKNGDAMIAQLLLRHGADIECRGYRGQTAAIRAVIFNRPECLKVLVDLGADLEAHDKYCHTPLHWAAYTSAVPLMHLLLDHGAELEAVNENRFTPLHIAASTGAEQAARVLLDRGAVVNTKTEFHGTALCLAARSLNITNVKNLLEYGADPNARSSTGRTPLHWAMDTSSETNENLHGLSKEDVINRKIEITTCLLEHGADLYIPDANGRLVEDLTENPALKQRLEEIRMAKTSGLRWRY